MAVNIIFATLLLGGPLGIETSAASTVVSQASAAFPESQSCANHGFTTMRGVPFNPAAMLQSQTTRINGTDDATLGSRKAHDVDTGIQPMRQQSSRTVGDETFAFALISNGGMLRAAGRISGVLGGVGHGTLWVTSLLIMSVTTVVVWRIGGAALVRRSVPVGTAVSLCVILGLWTPILGPPWDNFSPTTASMTVVLVMEMGTLERFLVRCALRSVGTVCGAGLAITGAELADLCSQQKAVIVAFVFAVFMVDAALMKKYAYLGAIFSTASSTFVLVFFGYIQRGWPSVWRRTLSVFIGELLALFCTIFYDFVCWDLMSTLSEVAILSKAGDIFDKALVALDFAFIRNEINSAATDAEVLSVIGLTYQQEAREWFRLDSNPSVEELRGMARSSAFQCLPIDISVSTLQAECRACYLDMRMVRALIPRFCRPAGPASNRDTDYGSLSQVVHPVFVQASSLAHGPLVDPQLWHAHHHRLEKAQAQLQSLQRPVQCLFSQLLEGSIDEIVVAMTDVSEILCGARNELSEVRAHKMIEHTHERRNLDAFIQGLELVIADVGSFVLATLKLFKIPQEESSDVIRTLEGVASFDLCNWTPGKVKRKPDVLSCLSSKHMLMGAATGDDDIQ